MPFCSPAHAWIAYLRARLAFDGSSKNSTLGERWKTSAELRGIGPRSVCCFTSSDTDADETSQLQAARRCTARSSPWLDTKALLFLLGGNGLMTLIANDRLLEVVCQLKPSYFGGAKFNDLLMR